MSLHWRHNDHDGVSNHQPHGCLLNRLFRRRSKKTSKLRVAGLYAGNSPGPLNSPNKGPVTRKMFPFDDVIMVTCSPTDKVKRNTDGETCPDNALTKLSAWYCRKYSLKIFHFLLPAQTPAPPTEPPSCRCLNGGYCPNPQNPLSCVCQTGYIGTLCEIREWSLQH